MLSLSYIIQLLMLLLGLDAILLIYTSAGTGIFLIGCLQKIFRRQVYANPLGVVLAGVVFSTLYFNLISFWLPVNYYCLIPPVVLSSYIFVQKRLAAEFIYRVQRAVAFLFSRPNVYAVLPVCIMLAYCWLLPPVNADGPGYHYSTILWFEKYRVVPGLANVDGRLAYNSAAFIVQAAYAFTELIGQSLYPLNGVLTALFFLWMFKRILQSRNIATGISYFILLYLENRALLVNMSSATADTLVLICLGYSIIQVFDALIYNKDASCFLLPIVLLLYAVTAKLSAYPALLLIPLLFLQMRKEKGSFLLLVKICAIAIFIYVPWLCRSIILSGYMFYPVPFIDIFSFDWKAPKDVLLLDYDYIKRMPVNFGDDPVRIQPPPFPQWVWPWVQHQLNGSVRSDIFILIAAICSPVYWLAARGQKIKVKSPAFYVWLVIYLCVIIWLANVPEYRFGIIFISFAIMMPLIYAASQMSRKFVAPAVFFVVLFVAESAWYMYSAPGRKGVRNFSFTHFLVYPLKDRQYYSDSNKADFNYTLLNNGARLYHQDSTHNCINAALPCMIYKYGTIEMRGTSLSDGFRSVQDDVKKNYPFVK